MCVSYHPLIPLVGALAALATALTYVIVFSTGNMVINYLNYTNSYFVNETIYLNNTLPYHFHVGYVNFKAYGNMLASMIGVIAPIIIILILVAYLIYGGRR